jgi:hypothetical protein
MRVVALDLPTPWMMATGAGDEFTARMFEAINRMLQSKPHEPPRPLHSGRPRSRNLCGAQQCGAHKVHFFARLLNLNRSRSKQTGKIRIYFIAINSQRVATAGTTVNFDKQEVQDG